MKIEELSEDAKVKAARLIGELRALGLRVNSITVQPYDPDGDHLAVTIDEPKP